MTAFAASAQTVCSRSSRDHACCASITTTRWLPQGMCDGVVAASAQTADSLSWRMEPLAYRTRRGCGEPRRRRRGGELGACVRVLRLRHACINSPFTPREASSFYTLTLKPRNKVSHEPLSKSRRLSKNARLDVSCVRVCLLRSLRINECTIIHM